MKKFFLTLSLACALVLTSQLPGSQSLATANTYGEAYFIADEYDGIRPLDITRGGGGLFVWPLPTYQLRPLDITRGGGGLFVRPLPTYQRVVGKNVILAK